MYYLGMKKQNLIKQSLSQPASMKYVCELLEINNIPNRSKLAENVCEYFGFYDSRGIRQLGSCLKALRELDSKDYFLLPVARNSKRSNSPRRIPKSIPLPKDVPDKAGMVLDLKLIPVKTGEQILLWNELMGREYPQGAGA